MRFLVNKDMKVRAEAEEEEEQYWVVQQRESHVLETQWQGRQVESGWLAEGLLAEIA